MIELKLAQYRSFMSAFRKALGVGHPENRGGDCVEVKCGANFFRYTVEDLYLTHLKSNAHSDWQLLTRHNYAQMGIADDYLITGNRIKDAFNTASPSGPKLVMIILATSEAARSQVVYQVIQQMLQDPTPNQRRSLDWSAFKPLLIGSWVFNTKENHKRKPVKFGPLGCRDYYNAKAVQAMQGIQSSGFQLD